MVAGLEPDCARKRFPRCQGIRPAGGNQEKKQMSSGKITIAATTFACMTLVSFGWSASAQAQDKQPKVSTHQVSRHVATGPQRHYRHVARGYYNPNPVAVGADLAAGAIDTAGAVAAGAINTAGAIAGAPFGAYASDPYPGPGGYYASSAWGDYDCRLPHAWDCRPYAAKDWSKP